MVISSNSLITFKSLKIGLVCSKKARKSYDSNGFLLQYKKRLQGSLISIPQAITPYVKHRHARRARVIFLIKRL